MQSLLKSSSAYHYNVKSVSRWLGADANGCLENCLAQTPGVAAISSQDIWAVGSFVNPNTGLDGAYMQHWDGKQWGMTIWPVFYGQLSGNSSVGLADISGTRDGQIIAVGSSVIFTQNPPIDDAARDPTQPFVLASCH